jgi:IS30 family transposase
LVCNIEGDSISHETIYAMIRADATGELAQNCRHKMKYSRKASRKHEAKATNIKNRVSIHENRRKLTEPALVTGRWTLSWIRTRTPY